MLRSVEPAVLTWRVADRWSVQENVGHLLDLEPLWLARVEDYVLGHEHLTPTDLQNRKTDLADHNRSQLLDIQNHFRTARQTLMHRLDSLDVSRLTQQIVHPRLSISMRLMDHLYFVAEHDDHHLATIWGILRSYKSHSA